MKYVDSVGGGKYAFRVYVTESSGAILGANFMTEMNVIFDEGSLQTIYLNLLLIYFCLHFLLIFYTVLLLNKSNIAYHLLNR